MKSILEHIKVPWTVSPSAGLELRHADTDVAPECSVSFIAGRITEGGKLDQRFVEIEFVGGAFLRVHWHGDTSGVECLGYNVPDPVDKTWVVGGDCPESMFYFVTGTNWIANLPSHFSNHVHYVLDGRDGCIEIAAAGYFWREWRWPNGVAIEDVLAAEPIANGSNVG